MTRIFYRMVGAVAVLIGATLAPPNAAAVVIGSTEVPLNGLLTDVRHVETNLGDLVADAFFWQARESGLNPTIAVVNGGAIRNNSIAFPSATPSLPADIDETFSTDVLPFTDDIFVVEDVEVSTLLAVLENSVAQAAPGDSGFTTGRFLQISGFYFSWDTSASAGSRVIDVFLDDLTPLIDDGVAVSSTLLNIAMPEFIANGGDFYSMFPGSYAITSTGVLHATALTNFIKNGLSETVRATDYPMGGEGRISPIPEPGTLLLLGSGLVGLAGYGRKRRKA